VKNGASDIVVKQWARFAFVLLETIYIESWSDKRSAFSALGEQLTVAAEHYKHSDTAGNGMGHGKKVI
jgi:hypothetical protein